MNTLSTVSIPAWVAGLAMGLILGVVAPGYADHDLPKPPPLWFPLDEAERLALTEVPGGMIPISEGTFLMGSDPRMDRAAGPQEQPQREVYVDAFSIDRFEVSNVELSAVCIGDEGGLAAVLAGATVCGQDGETPRDRRVLAGGRRLLPMARGSSAD